MEEIPFAREPAASKNANRGTVFLRGPACVSCPPFQLFVCVCVQKDGKIGMLLIAYLACVCDSIGRARRARKRSHCGANDHTVDRWTHTHTQARTFGR